MKYMLRMVIYSGELVHAAFHKSLELVAIFGGGIALSSFVARRLLSCHLCDMRPQRCVIAVAGGLLDLIKRPPWFHSPKHAIATLWFL
eukprot:5351821-Amphidinium_carterae.1